MIPYEIPPVKSRKIVGKQLLQVTYRIPCCDVCPYHNVYDETIRCIYPFTYLCVLSKCSRLAKKIKSYKECEITEQPKWCPLLNRDNYND